VPAAYVLLNTEIGAGAEVVEALKKLEGVESAFNLWGVYDVIASVKAESMDGLSDIINRQIEKIEKIHSKLTMIISEKGVPSADKLSRQLF
jgi:DNA-binding Lrp family transcriptional regulator